MHELAGRASRIRGFEARLDQVFDRLDVVICRGLDVLDLLRILRREIDRQSFQGALRGSRNLRQFRDAGFLQQMFEPADLGQCAVTNQSVFAEYRS